MASRRRTKFKYKKPVRFLRTGQSIRVRGKSGKLVKRLVKGRSYVLEVVEKRKVVGTVNRRDRSGTPQFEEFTQSVINRIRSTRRQRLSERPRPSGTYRLTGTRFIRDQISDSLLRKIRRNNGKAFAFKIETGDGETPLLTHSVYFNGRISDEALRNLIVSDLIYTLAKNNFRVSPKLVDENGEEIEDSPKIKRRKEVQLELQFTKIEKTPQRSNDRSRKRKRVKA